MGTEAHDRLSMLALRAVEDMSHHVLNGPRQCGTVLYLAVSSR